MKPNYTLTPTEGKVIRLIYQGYNTGETAEKLNVSKRTVDFHLANIYDKLQVTNRLRAVRMLDMDGFFKVEDFE